MISPTRNKSTFFSWKWFSLFLVILVYILINIFQIGGDSFVLQLGNIIACTLALGVMIIAISQLKHFSTKGQNKFLWWGLAIGWALWTIAEIWWWIASMVTQEVPYPSWADFFWILGYIPLTMALWQRVRALPRVENPIHRILIWLSSLLSVFWTFFFILLPLVKDTAGISFIESVLNIFFPIADLVLLVLVLRIFFTYQQGLYGSAWGWISVGFIVHSISNLLFSYASITDLYYPNGQATILSTLGIDVPYTLAYLFWFIGLLIMRRFQKSHINSTNSPVRLNLVPNTHLLIFTASNNRINDVSANFSNVFQSENVVGKTIPEVLSCQPGTLDDLMLMLKLTQIIQEQTVSCTTIFGTKEVLLSGISVSSPQGEYTGAILLLRLYIEHNQPDDLLTGYQKGIVASLIKKMGIDVKEEEGHKQLLHDYYLPLLQSLYNRAFSEGGTNLADAFLSSLREVVKNGKWQIAIHPEKLLDITDISLQQTRESLPLIFASAKQFIEDCTDSSSVELLLNNTLERFDKSEVSYVSQLIISDPKSEQPG